jgi:phage terminase Nu1 subunit (DNA packaging protein)
MASQPAARPRGRLMATVNADKIAQALNLTPSRVHQLVKVGMPKEARGQFDPVKCMFFYIRYLQTALERKTVPTLEGEDAGERAARVRILRAQADQKGIELAKLRSQLVAVPDVEATVADLVRTTEAHIMAIPSRLAPELVGEASRMMIQAKLETAFRKALSRLAKSHSNEISADPDSAKEVIAANS